MTVEISVLVQYKKTVGDRSRSGTPKLRTSVGK